jgi:hypothetical protein
MVVPIPTMIAVSILSLRRCPGNDPDAQHKDEGKGRSHDCALHSI